MDNDLHYALLGLMLCPLYFCLECIKYLLLVLGHQDTSDQEVVGATEIVTMMIGTEKGTIIISCIC